MAVYSSVLQLVAAVSSITFVLVTGVTGLLGLGPAIFLVGSALAAMPAGRLMDRIGRRPVIAGGYLAASAGCALTALATNIDSASLLIVGFALTGAANGTALLIRTAAGDMYPAERRARGISYVLFGSVFGAILGPAVFGPLFSGRELDAARADGAVAGGGRDQPDRARRRLARPARPEGDRRDAAGRRRRRRRRPRRCARSCSGPA